MFAYKNPNYLSLFLSPISLEMAECEKLSASQARRRRRRALQAQHELRVCTVCMLPLEVDDNHTKCVVCLGVPHARSAYANPKRCPDCYVFSLERLRDRKDEASMAHDEDGNLQRLITETEEREQGRADPPGSSGLTQQERADHAAIVAHTRREWAEATASEAVEYAPEDVPDTGLDGADDEAMEDNLEDGDGVDAARHSDGADYGDDDEDDEDSPDDEDDVGGVGEDGEVEVVEGVVQHPDVPAGVAAGVDVAGPALAAPPARPAATLPYDDVELIDVYKEAAAKCNLPWPAPPPVVRARAGGYSNFAQLVKPIAPKSREKVMIPIHQDFTATFDGVWQESTSTSPTLIAEFKVLDCEKQAERGLEEMPKMDKALASFLSGGVFPAAKEPEFGDLNRKEESKTAKNAYKCVATLSRALAAQTLLQNSVSAILAEAGTQPKVEHMAKLSRHHLEMLRLTVAQTEMAARSMMAIIKLERARWVTLCPKWGRKNIDDPIMASSLFAAAMAEMKARVGQDGSDWELITTCNPGARPVQPAKTTKPPRGGQERPGRSDLKPPEKRPAQRQQTGGRSRNRRGNKPGGARAPSASPAPPKGKAQKKGAPGGGQMK